MKNRKIILSSLNIINYQQQLSMMSARTINETILKTIAFRSDYLDFMNENVKYVRSINRQQYTMPTEHCFITNTIIRIERNTM